MLDLWPAPERHALEAMLRRSKAGDFAVFDADNTLWFDDVTESLFAWLAHTGQLSLDSLNPALRPLPYRAGESIWSYYLALCALSTGVGYLWAVQVFSGFSPRELRAALHAMLASEAPVPATDLVDGEIVDVQIGLPRPFARMRELVAALEAADVRCWIVTASPEETVRLLACDPVHGVGIHPDRVCGVNLMMQTKSGPDWGARARAEGRSPWLSDTWLDARLTHHAIAPLTWYEGKVAAVRTWISTSQRPLLAAGDSPSDIPMQLLVDPARGLRLRIRADASHDARTAAALAARPGTGADGGWLTLTPEQLGPGG